MIVTLLGDLDPGVRQSALMTLNAFLEHGKSQVVNVEYEAIFTIHKMIRTRPSQHRKHHKGLSSCWRIHILMFDDSRGRP